MFKHCRQAGHEHGHVHRFKEMGFRTCRSSPEARHFSLHQLLNIEVNSSHFKRILGGRQVGMAPGWMKF